MKPIPKLQQRHITKSIGWYVFWRGYDTGMYGVAYGNPGQDLPIGSFFATEADAVASADKYNREIRTSVG